MHQEKLNRIREKIIQEATLVEEMIGKSLKGLQERKLPLLLEVIEKDETIINRLEVEIDELCTDYIALNQPEARDLRTVLMMLKMNADLERMGDQAVNISQSAMYLLDHDPLQPIEDFIVMANETKGMIRDSINAFVKEDPNLATEVCKRDDIVDQARDKILEDMYNLMANDQSQIKSAIHIIRVANELERIADLTTNICEDTIFISEGRVIKHHQNDHR